MIVLHGCESPCNPRIRTWGDKPNILRLEVILRIYSYYIRMYVYRVIRTVGTCNFGSVFITVVFIQYVSTTLTDNFDQLIEFYDVID